MAYSILVNPGSDCGYEVLKNIATANQREIATVEFVTDECIIPDEVDVDEVFDIKIVYKLCTIEERNYNGILDHFPSSYDGGFYKTYYEMVVPYIVYWIWRFSQLDFWVLKGIVSPEYEIQRSHGRASLSPPQKFTWNFHGTVSDLLGEKPAESGLVKVGWALSGKNYGWWENNDFWPYNWQPPYNFFEPCQGGAELTKDIWVNLVPTPPYPLFNSDLGSVLKESVTPDESFGIKVSIVNQNHYSGAYSIDCYCLGHRTTLKEGTIGGNQIKTETFYVTVNQIAGQQITETRYLSFEIRVSNINGETDRWQPGDIAVIVTEPSEVSLSGKVTDKITGLALQGVYVSIAGRSTSTNSSGIYSFEDLEPGTYEVEFSKAGYWEETKSKRLLTGPNSLNLAMTSEDQPHPEDGEIPWALIGLGGLAAGGLALVLSNIKKKGTK